jgi:2-polyprenyl-6-methoxyphenol hydroxylase-like FAD-dependent oxidoreductase
MCPPPPSVTGSDVDVDVLVVGAGPTGLTLTRELRSLGVSVLIVDRAPQATLESRALAIQARTLEVLARNGLADDLVAAGRPTSTLVLHDHGPGRAGRTRTIPLSSGPADTVPLVDDAGRDTRFPFLLFLSQAATERVLIDRLASAGTGVRRGVALTGLAQDAEGVTCTLESPGVPAREVRARFVVGCDGAHSSTRKLAGIAFTGHAFPHRFLLADLEIDGVQPGNAHAYLSEAGPLLLFPLGTPASWRLIVMLPPRTPNLPVTLELLQSTVSRYTRERLVLHHPVWLTEFSISSRLAQRFRRGKVFLAGDAAHIHSPAGAQGMNTGMQDAVNLGWKLALVCSGATGPALLRSYDRERLPVARAVLAGTDRAFTVATSRNPLVRTVRAGLAARVAGIVLRSRLVRRSGFRSVSQLSVRYLRSPLSVEGAPRLRRGPKPGERFPQPGLAPMPVDVPARTVGPHGAKAPSQPVFRLLLCGPEASWPPEGVQDFLLRWGHLVAVQRSAFAPRSRWSAAPRTLVSSPRQPGTALYLVRWDGYVGYRAAGTDLGGAAAYLRGLGATPRG